MKHETFKQYSWWLHKKTKQFFIVLGVFPADWKDQNKGLEVFILFQGEDIPEPRTLQKMEDLLKKKEITAVVNYSSFQ